MQRSKIYFLSTDYQFNPSYAENFTTVVFNDTEGISRVNMSGYLKTGFATAIVSIMLAGIDDNPREYSNVFFKGTVNTCKISSGIFGNVFVSFLMQYLPKHSNFRFDCPQEKGFYYLANMPIIDGRFLPPFLVGRSGRWMYSLGVKIKIPKVKSPVHLYSLKFFGIIVMN